MNIQERKAKIAEINNSNLKSSEKIKALQDFVNVEKQEENQDSILTVTLQDILKSLGTPQTQFIGVLKGDKPIAGVDYPIPQDGHTPTDEELLTLIKPLIPKVKDGKTPTQKQLLDLIRPLIPEVKDGETPTDERLIALIKLVLPEQVILDTGEIIVGKINDLEVTPENQIDATHIKNFPKEVQKHSFAVQRNIAWFTGGAFLVDNPMKVNFGTGITASMDSQGILQVTAGSSGYTVETPTGTIDGSNTSFTVTVVPVYIVSDGTTYFANNGYTISGLTVTMAVAPTSYIRSFHT